MPDGDVNRNIMSPIMCLVQSDTVVTSTLLYFEWTPIGQNLKSKMSPNIKLSYAKTAPIMQSSICDIM